MTPELQSKIEEAYKFRDAQRAWEILVLANKDSSIKLSRLDVLRLNYLRMNALSSEKLFAIMKESLLAAYQIPEFDLDQRLADYFELLDFVDVQIDFLFKLKALIQDHEELLGSQKITVNGKAVAPTIANWIADYQSMINPEMKDVLGEMRYINTGPNLRILTIPQRHALQSILKLYDRVSSLVELYQELPEKLSAEDEKDFIEWATKKVEEESGTAIPEQGTAPIEVVVAKPPAKTLAPTAPRPIPTPPAQPPITPQVTPPVAQPIATPKPYTIPLQKDLDLSTQPKKGLVFDIPTNVNLDKEVEERKKRAQQQAQLDKIQTKLEDLKKRKKQ